MTLDLIMTTTPETFSGWEWAQIAPLYDALAAEPLTDASAIPWLTARARLNSLIDERENRLYVATTLNTADSDAETRYFDYLTGIGEPADIADQRLREIILASGVQPPGYDTVLRGLRAEAALFREVNIPLLTEEERLSSQYGKIAGAQTVQWDGEEKTLDQLLPFLYEPDRAVRERAWRAHADRQLADRAALNSLWTEMLTLRDRIAHNAGHPDYRSYMWQSYARFDYTPDDCRRFHDAIESQVVPAARILRQRQRERLGVESLKPWDTEVDPFSRPPLRPFSDADALIATSQTIFNRVDPALGAYFADMRAHDLLDLANRRGKAPGGYCTEYPVTGKPFIFMNAVGLHDDVQTMLHEGGHAFHTYAYLALEEYRRVYAPTEFAEVASMSMELLAAPYLTTEAGGFYIQEEAARARSEHLHNLIFFLPYMACVDAFQHWAYTHVADALDPAQCDAAWDALWQRFMPGIDYTGLEDVRVTGWHRKLHIFQVPLYYVEYGIAQVGAVQVWMNAMRDQAGAVAAYRRALALGGAEPLPKLFEAAGARLAMDEAVLRVQVEAIMHAIDALDGG